MPPRLAAYTERHTRFMKPVAVATTVIAHGQARGMLTDYSRTDSMASKLAWRLVAFLDSR